MENASKALLIAGAILLVIAIIAIAVGIVSKTRGTMNVAENQIDTMEVRMHNNQFTIYEGKVTGEDVKECISKVLSNNTQTKKTDMKVDVVVKITGLADKNYGATSGYSTTLNSGDIPSNYIFQGVASVTSKGIINRITFTQI